jgi:endoglycosylceramidase
MWPGIEPTRGVYNESYLRALQTLTQRAAAHGIYTLLDGHQDAFSEAFCGEGFPDWARHFPEPHGPGKFPAPWGAPLNSSAFYREPKLPGAPLLPTRQACAERRSFIYQGAKEPAAAYEALYTNVDGIGDAWAAMWGRVARQFRGQSQILGLDLLNEPCVTRNHTRPRPARPPASAPRLRAGGRATSSATR